MMVLFRHPQSPEATESRYHISYQIVQAEGLDTAGCRAGDAGVPPGGVSVAGAAAGAGGDVGADFVAGVARECVVSGGGADGLGSLGRWEVSAEALGQARRRMPVDLLRHLVAAVTLGAMRGSREAAGVGRWRGCRVLMMDGSGVSSPDTQGLVGLRDALGVPGRCAAGPGFPVMHLWWLIDLGTGLIAGHVAARCRPFGRHAWVDRVVA